MRKIIVVTTWILAAPLAFTACGGDAVAPPAVTFGETTFVLVLNPVVNDDNAVVLPAPGTVRNGVAVVPDSGMAATSDSKGIAVLPVPAGARTLSLSGGGDSADVALSIAEQELREVALAFDSARAEVMASVVYPFGGQVIEITPTTPLSVVNDALASSNVIVFFRGGVYAADTLTFSGSNVTLFGEGERGGAVTLMGTVIVDGSSNRLRGVTVKGNLSIPGSDAGLSFSRVEGDFTLGGSSAVLLQNAFCGAVTLAGSNPTVLGNAGLAPIAAPSDCP